ncbi:MAG: DoxX family protein [Inquilinaceae bacterium]
MTTTTSSHQGLPGAVSALAAPVGRGIGAIETWLAPILLLAMRVWIARVFFNSGLTKLDSWENTKFLFQYEYAVPILPFEVTAVLATMFELGMPVLLVLGLLSRLAVLPLLAMSLVIQFVLGAANPAYDNVEHFYWMFLLGAIFVFGPGRISVDHLISRRLG